MTLTVASQCRRCFTVLALCIHCVTLCDVDVFRRVASFRFVSFIYLFVRLFVLLVLCCGVGSIVTADGYLRYNAKKSECCCVPCHHFSFCCYITHPLEHAFTSQHNKQHSLNTNYPHDPRTTPPHQHIENTSISV